MTLRALYSSRYHSIPSTAVNQGAVKRVLLYHSPTHRVLLSHYTGMELSLGGTLEPTVACSACRPGLLLDRVSSTARAPWTSTSTGMQLWDCDRDRHMLFMLSFVRLSCIQDVLYALRQRCSYSRIFVKRCDRDVVGDGWLIGRGARPLSASTALSLWVSLIFFPCSSNSTVYDRGSSGRT